MLTDVLQQYIACLNEIITHLRSVYLLWDDMLCGYSRVDRSPVSYSADTLKGPTGRPKFIITKEQLEYLRSMSFMWSEISQLLGVSCSTIYRRRQELGVSRENDRGLNLSETELREKVQAMRREQPALGQTMLWARLRSEGYYVTRSRLRDAVRSTDPLSNVIRWNDMTPRRPYSVPSPNSLWHLGRNSIKYHR